MPMILPRCDRDPGAPRRSYRSPLLTATMLAGCGPAVSLDPAMTTTGQPSTGVVTTSADITGSSSSDDPTAMTAASTGATTDVPDPPLPPGACPSECSVQFDTVWTWDEQLIGDPALDHRITAMLRTHPDALVIAEQKEQQAWLRRINDDGVVLWNVQPGLQCECEIFDLASRPNGTLLIGAHGMIGISYPVVSLGFFDLQQAVIGSVSWEGLFDADKYRMGSLFVIDDLHSGITLVDADFFAEGPINEVLVLNYYQGDFLYDRAYIDSQPAQGSTWRPTSWSVAPNAIAVGMTHVIEAGDQGFLVWLGSDLDPSHIESLPAPPDAIAPGADEDIFILGHTTDSDSDATTLSVSHGRPNLELSWSLSIDIPGASIQSPVLTTAGGVATIAARTTTEDEPGDRMLTLARVDTEGNLLWSSTRSVPSDPGPMFVEVFDEAVVLAYTIGRLTHIEMLEPSCSCG